MQPLGGVVSGTQHVAGSRPGHALQATLHADGARDAEDGRQPGGEGSTWGACGSYALYIMMIYIDHVVKQ